MDTKEFLEQLQALIGGEVDVEEFSVGAAPRLYAQYRGYFVKVDFVADGELILDVNTLPPHHLRLRREGVVSRALAKLGVIGDHTTGDAVFDGDYLIDDATQEQAAAFLSPEVRSLIRRLEPFTLFALTHKEYRCLKHVSPLDDYPPQRAAADLDALIRIVELTQGVGGGHRAR